MSILNGLYCLDIPSKQTAIKLNFQPLKNVVFLTGHNGVGKTKILKAIHENVCIAHDNNSFTNINISHNYLLSLNFSNGNRETVIQKDITGYSNDEINKLSNMESDFETIHKMEWDKSTDKLKNLYSKIPDRKNKALDTSIFTTSSKEHKKCVIQSSKRNKNRKIPHTLFFSYDVVHYSGNKDYSNDLSYTKTLEHNLQLTLERFKELPEESKPSKLQEKINLLKNELNKKKEQDKDEIRLINDILNSISKPRTLIVDRLLSVLNSFFKETNREIIFDADEVIKCKLLKNNEIISWRELSKGEKNIIFLCFSVYFYSKEDVIFLIDEPETALHISWQEKLIKNLIKLSPSSQFIIATHAPSIVFKTEQEQYFNLENIQNVSK